MLTEGRGKICQNLADVICERSLIETLNVYLIQLKTECCQVNFMCNHNHIINLEKLVLNYWIR